MELLNKEEMELLLTQGEKEPCISIYMPTQKGREGAKENSIRFKNLLSKAEEQLEDRGLHYSDKDSLLDSAKKLVNESIYWANQSDGLAYFITYGFSRYYKLPVQFTERAVVRKSFHLKPLFPLLSSDGMFYILALSQKDARLLRGTQSTIEEMDLSKVVERFETEFGEELSEQYLQFYTGAPASGKAHPAIYYGHGGEIDSAQKERLLKYFRFIDREIQDLIGNKYVPIILACVDFLAPLYKASNKHTVLFEETIKGNPENISSQELHKKAWEIVKPHFQQKQEEAKERYHNLKGTGKTSNNILEILPASYHGRISDLFVTKDLQQWGYFDPESENIKLTDEQETGTEDLIDLAAAKSYANNGSVFALEYEQMPDTAPAAAIFRW